MIKDMTTGNPTKILWNYSLPLLFSIVFQQLYNIADSVIAGQFVGVNALAAVGASYPITMIFMAFAQGCNVGGSVVISQLFGAKEHTKMKTAINTSLITTLSLSLILTGVGLLTCRPSLVLLNTPNDIMADSMTYLNIYIYGLFFLFAYNICTGIFTALGDSKTPLYFLIASSLSNIGVDILFVTVFQMGVAGVAWATFLCQGIAAICAFITAFFRLRKIKTTEKSEWFSLPMLGQISKLAIPSILQQSFISIGNLFIQGLVNRFSVSVIAGYSAAVKLNTFAVTCFNTLSTGVSGFTAQNIGAMNADRVRKGYRASFGLAACVAIPFMIAFIGFGGTMSGLFMNQSDGQAAIEVAKQYLFIVTPFYPIVSIKVMTDGVLRGASCVWAFTASTFTDLILRVGISYVLALGTGLNEVGVWLSWPIGWVLGMIVALVFYAAGTWKKHLPQTEA